MDGARAMNSAVLFETSMPVHKAGGGNGLEGRRKGGGLSEGADIVLEMIVLIIIHPNKSQHGGNDAPVDQFFPPFTLFVFRRNP